MAPFGGGPGGGGIWPLALSKPPHLGLEKPFLPGASVRHLHQQQSRRRVSGHGHPPGIRPGPGPGENPGATGEHRRDRSSLRFWFRAEHLEPLVRRSLLFLPLLVLLVAFFFAASRGAIMALGVGLAIMAFLWAGRHSARWPLYLLAAFLAGVALYSLWLGGATVFARVMNISDQGRDIAFWGALGLFKKFPLVGAGLGTFDDLSYGFVPVTLSQARLTYAHNDWVQLLAETGLVGFTIVAGGWCLFYGHLIRQWRRRRDPWARGLGLGGLAALAAGAFHALGEFPFHIPAYSITYAAVAALTYVTLHQHQGRDVDYAAWRPAGSRVAPWLCAGLILVQAAYMGQAWFFWQAERAAPPGGQLHPHPPDPQGRGLCQSPGPLTPGMPGIGPDSPLPWPRRTLRPWTRSAP